MEAMDHVYIRRYRANILLYNRTHRANKYITVGRKGAHTAAEPKVQPGDNQHVISSTIY